MYTSHQHSLNIIENKKYLEFVENRQNGRWYQNKFKSEKFVFFNKNYRCGREGKNVVPVNLSINEVIGDRIHQRDILHKTCLRLFYSLMHTCRTKVQDRRGIGRIS